MKLEISPEDRLQLMRFACAFAWADLEVQPQERAVIARLVESLELPLDEERQVREWLKQPPPIDDLDPTEIPRKHRLLFLELAWAVVSADGNCSREEMESWNLFRELSK